MGAKRSVLFVDDDVNVLRTLFRTVNAEPYCVLLAVSGAEALAVLEAHSVDLIVSDLRMPGLNGLELLKKVQEKHPSVAMMLLTAYADAPALLDALNNLNVQKVLLKPWDEETLKTSIRHALMTGAGSSDHKSPLRSGASFSDRKRARILLEELEKDHPGITQVHRDDSGAVVLTGNEDMGSLKLTGDICKRRLD